MNRINPVVVFLTLAALAAIFLIVQDRAATGPANPVVATTASNSASAEASSAETRPGNTDPGQGDSKGGEPASVRTRDVACRIDGLKAQPCNVYVAVFESREGFPKSEYSRMTAIVPATEDHVELSLALPENSRAAIAVFQDLDGNGKLSKNAFGLPTEPYGFSNNARAVMGPPSFEQAVIHVSDAGETLGIRVR